MSRDYFTQPQQSLMQLMVSKNIEIRVVVLSKINLSNKETTPGQGGRN